MLKILLKVGFVLSILFFSSCKKDDSSIINDSTVSNADFALLKEMKTMPDPLSKKLAYSLFSPDQKMLVWKDHFDEYIKLNDLSPNQTDHIKLLAKRLTPQLFTKGDSTFLIFAKDWLATAKLLFEKDDLTLMIASLERPVSVSRLNVEEPPLTPNCDCKSTNWLFTSCDDCKTSKPCKIINLCGFLYIEDCNGKCADLTPPAE